MSALAPSSLFARQFVSYAQNYEDVMLWRALRQVERGFYIDAGAQSAETDSVTKAFSLMGWHGINLEPHPTYFEQLVRLRPDDINLNVALGERSGSLTMNLIEDSGLSTADDEIAAQHAASGYALRRHEVSMLTLAEVWHKHVPHGQPVHFLKVDVEGFEQAVLMGNDWRQHRPWIVLVEAMLPNAQTESHEAWEPILTNAGYTFVYADGLNRFYLAHEQARLADAFKYPPNVFDGFVTALERSLRESEAALRARLDAALAAERGATERASDLLQQMDSLERSLYESHRRIECVEASAIQAREREMELKDRLDAELAALRDEVDGRDEMVAQAVQRAEAAEQRAEAAEQRAGAAEQRAGVADQQRRAVVDSPWWRITGPGRALLTRLPGSARRQLRRTAKAVWWAATPWRIPARLHFIRKRRSAEEWSGAVEVDPAELNLYPDRAPGRPPVPPIGALPREIVDRTDAARWCLVLLRSQPDVRARFSRALSQPHADGFIDWIQNEGGARFGLPGASRSLVASVLQEDFGDRARRYYLSRPDVLALHPDGLGPHGRAGLFRWFVQFGCCEGALTPEEVLWLFVQASEPAMKEV